MNHPSGRIRAAVAVVAIAVALVLQVSVFPSLAWHGIVPNLCLLVVVGAALTINAPAAMVLGFVAGVALDLVPPADHVAGRWALALTIVAFLAARVRQDVRPTATAVVATVAAASFIGTSIFALSGIVLGESGAVPDLLQVIAVAVLWDVLLTPLVLAPLMTLFGRLDPQLATT